MLLQLILLLSLCRFTLIYIQLTSLYSITYFVIWKFVYTTTLTSLWSQNSFGNKYDISITWHFIMESRRHPLLFNCFPVNSFLLIKLDGELEQQVQIVSHLCALFIQFNIQWPSDDASAEGRVGNQFKKKKFWSW